MSVDKWPVSSTSKLNVLPISISIPLTLPQGLYKYDQEVYDMFMDSFDLFPICAIVNAKFIALHGGLSPLL